MSAPGDAMRETILLVLTWAAEQEERRLTLAEIRARIGLPVPISLVSGALEDLVRSGYAERNLRSAAGPRYGITPAGYAYMGEKYERVPRGDKTEFKVKSPDLVLSAPGAKWRQAVQDYRRTSRMMVIGSVALFAGLLLLIAMVR